MLLAALLFLAPTAGADEHGGGLTVHQIARLQRVGEAVVSPDGSAIAYVVSVPRDPFEDEDGPARLELHVIDTAPGATPRPYVTGERVSDVAWVPGKREISFVAQRGDDEHAALWAISLDGGEAQKVLTLASDVGDYSWSPDGRQVAALAKAEEPAEQKKLRDQGFTQTVYEEQDRPVEVWIATRGETAGDEPRSLGLEGYARGVAWSPAGDRLAVKVSPAAGPDDGLVATRGWIVAVESGEVIAKLANPGKLGDLAWSPDGAHLAMISAEDPSDPREGRLMVVGSGGGELRDLLPGLEAHVLTAAWNGDGRLVYLVGQGVETWIGSIAADGSGRQTVLAGGGPIWDDLSLAEDGTMALVGSTPTHPDEVFHFAAGSARRLTDSNPWLAEVELAPQEAVRHTARDGLELEGVLIRPLGEKAGARYPLVLMVHGGPEAHVSNGWPTSYSQPGQALAARGFAVFYPNYRASTGRGVAFSKLNHQDLAGKEFDDLVDAVDHLVATGLADRDRVGITGGSYGGFATAWASTYYSERFAAGVMFVGISNNTGKLGTSDIPVELYQVHSRMWPWQNWQFFLERSPIYYVEQARTPLLIAGGDADPRVHPSQSLQLYRYLKLIGETPVRLVTYPGEKHGNRRAAARLDYSLRLVRWMEHYLQGPGGDPPNPEIDYGQSDEEEAAQED